MGVILSAAYIVAKGSDLLQRIKFLKRSFIKFLQKTVINNAHGTRKTGYRLLYLFLFSLSLDLFDMQSFGTTPTKEQIQAAGK